MTVKTCPMCGEKKSLKHFYFNMKTGYVSSYCKSCKSEYNSNYRKKTQIERSERPTKVCNTCGKELFTEDFYTGSNGKLKSECKACSKKRSIESYRIRKLKASSKKCSRCGIEKPASEFYFYKSTSKLSSECKKCKKELSNNYMRKKKMTSNTPNQLSLSFK